MERVPYDTASSPDRKVGGTPDSWSPRMKPLLTLALLATLAASAGCIAS